ncbi:MAG TPA: DUF4267 domain-containing protein [Jatrophihabitans sp.]|jgi:hypothetical protein|nr:DUF4267 domain-containing protein [Jatrophihabitans sp.]
MTQPSAADSIRKASALGALGFGGVAVVLPRLFTALYGLTSDPNVRTLTRLWGTRTAALGAIILSAERPEDQRQLMMLGTAMNAADALVAMTAGGNVSARGRFLGALTSGGFAAAGVYALATSK